MKFLFFLVFPFSILAQDKDCSLPRNLKYVNSDSSITVERINNIEIQTHRFSKNEYSDGGEFILEYTVSKLSPCTYKLEFSRVVQYVESIDVGFSKNYVQEIVLFNKKEIIISTLTDYQGDSIPNPQPFTYYIIN